MHTYTRGWALSGTGYQTVQPGRAHDRAWTWALGRKVDW